MSEESYIRMQMDRIQIPSIKSSREIPWLLYLLKGVNAYFLKMRMKLYDLAQNEHLIISKMLYY